MSEKSPSCSDIICGKHYHEGYQDGKNQTIEEVLKIIDNIFTKLEANLIFPFEGNLISGKEIERPHIMSHQRTAFNKIKREYYEEIKKIQSPESTNSKPSLNASKDTNTQRSGCGERIFVAFDSDKPEEGGEYFECGLTFICEKCQGKT